MCSCELSAQLCLFFTTFLQNNSRYSWSSLSYRHWSTWCFCFVPSCFWIFCKALPCLGFFVAMSLFSGDNELLSIHHVGRCFRNFCENFDLAWSFLDFLEPHVFSPRIGNILQQAARSSVFDTPHADWYWGFWKPRWSWNLLRWTRSGRPMSRSLGLPIKCHSMSLIFVDFVDPGIWHCMLAFMTLICASF